MTDNSNKNYAALIAEAMESRSLSSQKLAGFTSVPERFISAILNMKTESLPPAPYVRGYFVKIGEVLGLNSDELWQNYQKESSVIKRSGPLDELPTNRYALTPINKKLIIGSAALLIAIGYLVIRADDLIGKPNLYLASPLRDNLIVTESAFTARGKIKPGDKLTINDKGIYVKEDGSFEENILLKPGLNTIEFKVARFLGREITATKQIFYSP